MRASATGFLAGLLATALLVVIVTSDDRSSAINAGTAVDASTARSVSGTAPAVPGRIDPQLIEACQRRIDGLTQVYPLIFDPRSETLKAEVQQVVFGVIEVAADCPGTALVITATLGIAASDFSRELTQRRMRYLRERLESGGLRVEITDAWQQGPIGSSRTPEFRFVLIPEPFP